MNKKFENYYVMIVKFNNDAIMAMGITDDVRRTEEMLQESRIKLLNDFFDSEKTLLNPIIEEVIDFKQNFKKGRLFVKHFKGNKLNEVIN